MNSTAVRQAFLDFFKNKNHHIVPSSPMVIKDDPTLMFTNAGMNQFKDYFLGNREPRYHRIADTQKCLRVSGKHNDLEEVGHDTYHHTMFEMLGNWSFGDYFKKEAIEWGWELLTDIFGIEKGRLYVTIFEGDKKEGLVKDTEAYECWKKIVPADHILSGSKKDNFWEMGDTGPCGPCSEIHIDLRDDEERKQTSGSELVNKGNPLVIEIWNLVFIEFQRQSDGKLIPLPAKHVDTGLGFERLCMALQGKKSNYETDVFQPIIHAIAKQAGFEYGVNPKADVAMRVVADHLRAISFAIADGQVPSNNKAGYVIRRILRRALRYGYTFLDLKDPFIYSLVPGLAEQMGDVFPELKNQQKLIMNVIREEEAAFLRTLSRGISKFNEYIELKPAETIDGKFAFELYDTFGFPFDLTQLMAKENGWTVDMEEFNRLLNEQKTRSRQASSVETADWVIVHPEHGGQKFTGYDTLKEDVKISRYRKVSSKDGDYYQLIFTVTPFYAESGGQVGDRGTLISGSEKVEIENTVKENDLIIHITKNLPSNVSATFTAQVDPGKRRATANNHSATHLLHAALRRVLGVHVEQKGSLVDEDHLRFDFTHFAKMTKEEIRKVESLVNRKIWENIPRDEERELPLEKAKKMGAMALFGEKYGEKVRVVTFDRNFSVELCGGTHVSSTGQIGLFKIVSEGAIAAGIRRIEAITEAKAIEYYNSHLETLEETKELLKNPKDILKGIRAVLEENQQFKKQVGQFEKGKLTQIKKDLVDKVIEVNGIHFIAEKVDLDAESIKDLAFELKDSIDNLYLVLASENEGKANLTVVISENLVKERGMNAGDIIRKMAQDIGGGGGGQPHIATAGGKNPGGIPDALERAKKLLGLF